MADYGIGFLGIYLMAAELVGKTFTGTIKAVVLEKVESLKKTGDDEEGGKLRDRWIVYFKESKSGRGWLLNRTNAECIKAMWGRETENWLGHKITLFTQQVKVGLKMEPGIRVKGSPELEKPLQVEIKLPKRKAVMMTLNPTGKTAPAPKSGDAPTLDDALKLHRAGQHDDALALRASLSEDDQARFDMDILVPESQV